MRMSIALPLLAALLPAANAASETTTTVMTFNLRYAGAKDGKFCWQYRKDLLIDTIRQASPLLLGTQECMKEQADYIVERLPEYKMIGRGREADGGGEMSAIFYRSKELSLVDSGHFWLSETPDVPGSKSWDSSLTRIVTYATFTFNGSGAKLYYFNTHFDHRGEEARKKSAQMLAARIAALPPDAKVLVTGDFNAGAGHTAPWQVLINAGLQDAWFSAAQRRGPECTFHGFAPIDPKSTERIDWIFTRGATSVKSCETVQNAKDGIYPSDHCAVVARVVWPF